MTEEPGNSGTRPLSRVARAALLMLSLVGFCAYWALPPATDEIGIAIALLALSVSGAASGWKASEPGPFRPIGPSIGFAWKASVAWTTAACFAEYLMTDLTATLTLLQFPSWILLGALVGCCGYLVGYLARAVSRGLRDSDWPQILRDIGQVVSLVLGAVALLVALGSVPRDSGKQDKQSAEADRGNILPSALNRLGPGDPEE